MDVNQKLRKTLSPDYPVVFICMQNTLKEFNQCEFQAIKIHKTFHACTRAVESLYFFLGL